MAQKMRDYLSPWISQAHQPGTPAMTVSPHLEGGDASKLTGAIAREDPIPTLVFNKSEQIDSVIENPRASILLRQ